MTLAEKITELALEICAQARKYGLWRMGSIIEAALQEHLPEDAIAVTRGRLQVAVMRIWPRPSRHPELCSQFQERDDLINAIMDLNKNLSVAEKVKQMEENKNCSKCKNHS